jgi:hypothetical protein
LFGSIFLKDEDVLKHLDTVDKKAAGVGMTFGDMAKKIAGVGIAIGTAGIAIGAAMLSIATKTADAASEINDMSERTGLNTDRLQELKYACGQVGVEFNSLTVATKGLTNFMADASDKGKKQVAVFKELHISTKNAYGQLRTMDDIFPEVINALADMQDITRRNALANDIFGKSANEIVPLLNQGSEGIKKLTDRAHELGAVMNKDAIQAGDTFGDTIDDIKTAMGGIFNQIGSSLIPIMQRFADWIVSNMPQIRATIDTVINKYIVPGINGFIKAVEIAKNVLGFLMPVILGVSAAFLAFNIITKGAMIIEGLINAWRVASAALALYRSGATLAALAQLFLNGTMISGPFLIVAAAVGVLVAAIYLLWKNWDDFIYTWSTSIEWIKNTFMSTFNGIRDFIVGIFKGITDTASNIINGVVGFFTRIIEFFENIVDRIRAAFSWLTGFSGNSYNATVTTKTSGARAEGGPVSSGMPYLVGEKGPELFMPSFSGSIIPNNKLGSGININIHNPVILDKKMADKLGGIIVGALRDQGVQPS